MQCLHNLQGLLSIAPDDVRKLLFEEVSQFALSISKDQRLCAPVTRACEYSKEQKGFVLPDLVRCGARGQWHGREVGTYILDVSIEYTLGGVTMDDSVNQAADIGVIHVEVMSDSTLVLRVLCEVTVKGLHVLRDGLQWLEYMKAIRNNLGTTYGFAKLVKPFSFRGQVGLYILGWMIARGRLLATSRPRVASIVSKAVRLLKTRAQRRLV
jgi:hypothetical protein